MPVKFYVLIVMLGELTMVHEGRFSCVECGAAAETLYRRFDNGITKLSICVSDKAHPVSAWNLNILMNKKMNQCKI